MGPCAFRSTGVAAGRAADLSQIAARCRHQSEARSRAVASGLLVVLDAPPIRSATSSPSSSSSSRKVSSAAGVVLDLDIVAVGGALGGALLVVGLLEADQLGVRSRLELDLVDDGTRRGPRGLRAAAAAAWAC